MKIEVGKFYRTRDGQKVGPVRKLDLDINCVKFEYKNNTYYCWAENGREYRNEYMRTRPSHDFNKPYDLVALWEDLSAVKEVTRKEIVPGRYGVVDIVKSKDGGFLFDLWKANPTSEELKEAARILAECADVL